MLLSVALHLLAGLLLPLWWQPPRIRLAMAQGGVVQVVPMPVAPPAEAAPSPARRGVAQEGAARRPQRPDSQPEPKSTPAPVRAVPPQAQPPEMPAAGPSAPQRPAQEPLAPSAEQRLTSHRSPFTMAAASGPAADSPPGPADTPPSAQGASSEPAPSQPEEQTEASVPAAAVLPRGGLPPPGYPKDALSQGLEGRVVLRLTVGPDGSVRQAEVVESSGWRDFDAVASRFASRVAFQPVSSGRAFRLAVEFLFSLRQDPQGRVEPTVEVRPVGHLEWLPASAAPASA